MLLRFENGSLLAMSSFPDSADSAPALAASVDWVRDLLTGSIGISIAVLAIAWVGFALLQGRIPLRDGARIVLGCFILFGAPIIATAFLQMARPEQPESHPSTILVVPPPVTTPTKPPQFDPYAGASVPNH